MRVKVSGDYFNDQRQKMQELTREFERHKRNILSTKNSIPFHLRQRAGVDGLYDEVIAELDQMIHMTKDLGKCFVNGSQAVREVERQHQKSCNELGKIAHQLDRELEKFLNPKETIFKDISIKIEKIYDSIKASILQIVSSIDSLWDDIFDTTTNWEDPDSKVPQKIIDRLTYAVNDPEGYVNALKEEGYLSTSVLANVRDATIVNSIEIVTGFLKPLSWWMCLGMFKVQNMCGIINDTVYEYAKEEIMDEMEAFSEAILGDIELETAKQFCEIQNQDFLEYLNVTKIARDIEKAVIEDSRMIMKILLSKSVNAVKEAVWVVVDWEKAKKIGSGDATFKETIDYTESLMTVLFVVDGVAGSIDSGVKVMSKDIGIPIGISVGDTIASFYKIVSIPVVSVGVGTEVVYGVSIPVLEVLGIKYMGGEDGKGDEGRDNPERKANSKTLRENLIKAGKDVPEHPNAAHHIVAGNSPKAIEAR